MSRIGKLPINIPEGVSVEITGDIVTVSGKRGILKRSLPKELGVEIKNNTVFVLVKHVSPASGALHGTNRAHIANMVKGVNEGWSKTLELVGTGYRAELRDGELILSLGFSHPVNVKAPEGINFKVEKTDIIIEGSDKELVGLISSKIRSIRPPEPYKGKGIRYKDEQIRRKAGKVAKAAGA